MTEIINWRNYYYVVDEIIKFEDAARAIKTKHTRVMNLMLVKVTTELAKEYKQLDDDMVTIQTSLEELRKMLNDDETSETDEFIRRNIPKDKTVMSPIINIKTKGIGKGKGKGKPKDKPKDKPMDKTNDKLTQENNVIVFDFILKSLGITTRKGCDRLKKSELVSKVDANVELVKKIPNASSMTKEKICETLFE
jgi:hypothetical protein